MAGEGVFPCHRDFDLTPHFHLCSASPKAAEAARLLLSDMWASRELQGILRQVRAYARPWPS